MLLSSHILSEVEQLCDRVTIIRAGRAVETGTLGELRHLKRTHFRVDRAGRAGTAWRRCPGRTGSAFDGDAVEFDVDPPTWCRPGRHRASGISGLTVAPPSLESLFLRHYSDARTAGEVRDVRRAAAGCCSRHAGTG